MTNYDKNLSILETRFPSVYATVVNEEVADDIPVYVGDALNDEKFLVVAQGDEIVPMNSSYHPSHEAERYVAQFKEHPHGTRIVLFGFSNGAVAQRLLEGDMPIESCIVYEPSIAMLRMALREYDFADLFIKPNFKLFVRHENGFAEFEKYMDSAMNYKNWQKFCYMPLARYEDMFTEEYKMIKEICERVGYNKLANYNTLTTHAKRNLENEVHSLMTMIDCKALDSLKGKMPEDVPCIIVAAGPSLEKNVEELRRAKGKSFIFCVDAALPFLLERDIEPDMACTIDPVKGKRHFAHPNTKNIPLAVGTGANFSVVNEIEGVKPIFFMTVVDYYERLFQEKGVDISYVESGGSVATLCFRLAVDMGFKTIVLIGQDLAFSNDKAHVGGGKLQSNDVVGRAMMVDGYYGDKVLTRGDYALYIDWYNLQIPEIKDRVVINATEGGAKIQSAMQMPLAEVIDTYCIGELDFATMLETVPQVWNSPEEKQDFYKELKRMQRYFMNFKRRINDCLADIEVAISMVKRKNYNTKDLKKIEKKIAQITNEIETSEGMSLLIGRIVETDLEVTGDLYDAVEDDLEMESIRLYDKMRRYFTSTKEAIDELLPMWQEMLDAINEKYQFE